ncbi:hypothetical protein [Paenibacillus tianmuensis]|nr:hypothetical protein [Paenibacillus tianmuensis]
MVQFKQAISEAPFEVCAAAGRKEAQAAAIHEASIFWLLLGW